MIVVSDASPIRALAFLDFVSHLERLFQRVLVTPSVVNELRYPRARYASVDITTFPFVEIRPVVDQGRARELAHRLDPPEAESLVMAVESGVQLVLIDELDGRKVAAELGLRCTGALGVLTELRKMDVIGQLAPLLARLKNELGFFLSDRLIADTLRSVGE